MLEEPTTTVRTRVDEDECRQTERPTIQQDRRRRQ
jgi:hypothetical protein